MQSYSYAKHTYTVPCICTPHLCPCAFCKFLIFYILGVSKPSLNALQLAIPQLANRWYPLGLGLGAKTFTLDNIRQSHRNDPEECCREMLKNWLNGKQDCGDCSRTWKAFLPVVERVVGAETSAFIKQNILHWEVEWEPIYQGSAESKCGWLFYCL